MRKKVTIPAAGETVPVSMTGKSVLTEFTQIYNEPEDVPLIGFNSGDNQFPIYPLSTYPNPTGKFNRLTLTGTASSAGNEIWLITVDECLPADIKVQHKDAYNVQIKATFSQTLDNNVFEFSQAQLLNGDLFPVRAAIQVIDGTTEGIRFAFDTDPDQAGSRTHFYWDEAAGLLEFDTFAHIDGFRAIASVDGENPKIIVQFEYRK